MKIFQINISLHLVQETLFTVTGIKYHGCPQYDCKNGNKHK